VSGVRASRPVQRKNKMKKLKLLTNIEEAYDELRYKTSWPSKKQLIKSAVIVMIASVIIALIIFIMDQVVDNIMHLIYSL
jgi:preprotein translocase subunit SecE